jgi:hypothetical protein
MNNQQHQQHYGVGRQNQDFLAKNGLSTHQLGGISSMASSNKTIPKKDPLRESN